MISELTLAIEDTLTRKYFSVYQESCRVKTVDLCSGKDTPDTCIKLKAIDGLRKKELAADNAKTRTKIYKNLTFPTDELGNPSPTVK